jgi:GMP synthase (glutamine-hydrolysing)
LLADNAFEPHHAFRIGSSAWGFQFHPEFGGVAMGAYVRHLVEAVKKCGGEPDAVAAEIAETPAAAHILPRFVELACQMAGARG